MSSINLTTQHSLRDLGRKGIEFKKALESTSIFIKDIFPEEQLFDKFRKEITRFVREGIPEEDETILRTRKSADKDYCSIMGRINYTVNRLRVQCYGEAKKLGTVSNIVAKTTNKNKTAVG